MIISFPFRNTVTEFHRNAITQHIFDAGNELNSVNNELKRLNAEINKLRGAVIIVESRRKKVEKKIARYRSLLAPIHRMPPEVLTEIFKFCCARNSINYYAFQYPGSLPSPMKLSSICGRWRQMILDTPGLWASLSACVDASNRSVARVYRATKLFMERSKSSPLTLEMEYHGIRFDGRDLFEDLVQNSGRWTSLDLSIETSALRESGRVLGNLRGQIPSLKRLVLRQLPTSFDNFSVVTVGDIPFLQAFEIAPSLQSVALFSLLVTPRLALPWHQIKDIQLQRCTINDVLAILAQCSAVEQLSLHFVNNDGPPHSGNHVTLLNVREISLSVGVGQSNALQKLVEHCTLPKLQAMELRNTVVAGRDAWDFTAALCDFVVRSACPLTSLNLHFVPITDECLSCLLPLIPTLTTLSIEEYLKLPSPSLGSAHSIPGMINPFNMIVTNHLLDRLSLSREGVEGAVGGRDRDLDTVLLPQLEHLTLVIHSEGLDQNILIGTLASRLPDITRSGVAPEVGLDSCLRSIDVTVKVRDRPTSSFDALSSLECFRDAGVKVRITIIRYDTLDEEEFEEEEEY
ncbi:hypothetical protein PQX77_016688 [Marasmius sp. AFHP31]|nr:hypothetical protein PQX77_016688 [Marasmius sp. AFHP31]